MATAALTTLAITLFLVGELNGLSVRVVTWNVLSNKWMDGGFGTGALNTLLGPMFNQSRVLENHDIYFVTLQENCFQCNENNVDKLAIPFLEILQKFGNYELAGSSMTRQSSMCQLFYCNAFLLGTTVSLLFAKEELITSTKGVVEKGCDSKVISNDEKGIAGMKATLSTGRFLCVAGLHLDYVKTSSREKCVKDFYEKASTKYAWNECDHVIMAGDFNTRPGPKEVDNPEIPASWEKYGKSYFDDLKNKDEFSGNDSWAGKPFIKYIRDNSGFAFKEGSVEFLPTYSILPTADCNGFKPCYKYNRLPGWTDRIIYSGFKEVDLYNSVRLGRSDHDPVVSVFHV